MEWILQINFGKWSNINIWLIKKVNYILNYLLYLRNLAMEIDE